MQALSQSGWPHLPHVWLVTRGAQAVGGKGAKPGSLAIEQAPLWGLGRVIGHQEFPGMWGGLVDLDPAPAARQAALLFDEIWHAGDEDQIAFRDGQRYVARLVPGQHLTPPLPPSFRPDGSYLITGGLGTLGLLVARWMVMQGARRLILMGRTRVPARSTWHQLEADHHINEQGKSTQRDLVQAIQELEKLGATIHLAAVDVADEEQLSGFLAAYEREAWPPIRGVIHTAGVVQDELLLRMTPEAFQRVLRPKLRGGWLLHRLLKDDPLDFFVLFSSTGSVIASLGQGNYAAANAFLDALAHHRRSLGMPALAIGWGPWSVGMVEQLKLEQFYTRRGIELITPEVGMQILSRVLGQRCAQLTAISANWVTARETSPLGTLPAMFALLGEQAREATTSDTNSGDGSLLQQLSEAQAAERLPLLASSLQELVARVLQLDPSQFSAQESLTSLGIDSMMAIEIKLRITASLKIDISVLELLQGTTILQLAARILSSLQFAETAPAADSADAALSMEEIQQLIEQSNSADLERLLAEIEQSLGNEATM
jgi:NAD(P)-dependent dehydrogenase (short-subunit alcohol dehydrogenase family)/acyl carrier protein